MLPLRKSPSDIVQQGDRYFRWRGGEVSRLESLFDAIIALALTLIVVSVEVPSSFSELTGSFRKLPAFAICFAILVMCWYYHYLFHRRYGLEDFPLVILNTILMFLVVFYVYPLKFLYSFMFAANDIQMTRDEVPTLMAMYSGGFTAIFLFLLLMYIYAYLKRTGLELNENEVLLTRMKICELSIYIFVGVSSLLLAACDQSPLAGLVYIFLGPLQGISGYLWGRSIVDP